MTLGHTPTGPPSHPDPLDRRIGQRLQQRREEYALMQHEMAAMLGIPKEQLDLYERGEQPITAAQLYRIAKGWDVPVMWFFVE